MDMKPSTGERIAQLRAAQKWSQTHLAHKVGTNVKNICDWENEVSSPSAQNIRKLCLLLATTADYLLCIDDIPSISLTGLSSDDVFRARALVQVLIDTSKSNNR